MKLITRRLLIWYLKVPSLPVAVMALTLDLGTDLKKSREMGPDSTDDLGDCKQNKKQKLHA